MTHVHILKGRNSTSCTFVGGENHRRDAYTKGKKTFFMRKPCFVCFTLCLFSRCFMVLWVSFSIYALLLSSLIASCLCIGHTYVLMPLCFIGCIFEWSFALLYDHCSHFHMIVWCMIKLLTCLISCLLDRILLVTLYLSFYHLIYLEGLMRFVQVF